MHHENQELSLGQAARIAGIGLLIMTIVAPFAQFYAFPSLLVPEDAGQTVQNLIERRSLFLTGIFAYLVNYFADIIVAWAIYILLAPVSRSLSLLCLLFCFVYIVMALTAVFNYVEVYRLLNSPAVASALTTEQLNTQIYVLFSSYQFDWGFSLLVFGVVLLLRGYLVISASYIPTVYGILLAIGGGGYIAYLLGLYIAPGTDLRVLALSFLGEPVFMIWLLFRGPRITKEAS